MDIHSRKTNYQVNMEKLCRVKSNKIFKAKLWLHHNKDLTTQKKKI